MNDSQLRSAISIRDARLPNWTHGRDSNLVKNGYANCNISLLGIWHIHIGIIVIQTFENDSGDCHFTLQSNLNKAIMSQRIDLASVWDPDAWLWAAAILSARITNGVHIQMIGLCSNGTIVDQKVS
ncbi:unnamed protein product, partial [Rotaria sp. Silwood1]